MRVRAGGLEARICVIASASSAERASSSSGACSGTDSSEEAERGRPAGRSGDAGDPPPPPEARRRSKASHISAHAVMASRRRLASAGSRYDLCRQREIIARRSPPLRQCM
eukprot:scaffold1480_cov123-Isochrysis_galbana.AAC.3